MSRSSASVGLQHFSADSGETLRVFGEHITIRADGGHTDGAYALVEVVSQPGGGAPPHVHTHETESFYVLEGEVEFYVGGKRQRLVSGEFAIAPPHVPHNFTNVGTTPLRMLVYAHPAGIEHFFRDAAALEFPPAIEAVAAVCLKHGIELLPPWVD